MKIALILSKIENKKEYAEGLMLHLGECVCQISGLYRFSFGLNGTLVNPTILETYTYERREGKDWIYEMTKQKTR